MWEGKSEEETGWNIRIPSMNTIIPLGKLKEFIKKCDLKVGTIMVIFDKPGKESSIGNEGVSGSRP